MRPAGGHVKTKLMIALVLGLSLVPFKNLTGQDKGAATMMLQGGSLGVVAFNHHLHQTALGDCNLCHNLFPQVSGSIEKMKAEGKLKKREVMGQCQDCHKQKAASESKTLPVKCGECHKK
jgi:cytochrome c-type protein NrfB